jgi:hypothetical protein
VRRLTLRVSDHIGVGHSRGSSRLIDLTGSERFLQLETLLPVCHQL